MQIDKVQSDTEPELDWQLVWSGDPDVRDAPLVLLNPGEALTRQVTYTAPGTTDPAPMPLGDDIVTVSFTDARGLRWSRTATAAPTRVVEDAPAPTFRLRWPWTWS